MKFNISNSAKRITPEKVRKDNSNIWRYSTHLQSELRKENFSKAIPEAYIAYKEALGEIELVSPYDGVDLSMDLEKFKKKLSKQDRELFNLLLLGMKQEDIAAEVGCSQPLISIKLKRLRDQFKDFYGED